MENGNIFVAEIDIKDFFDTIPLDPVIQGNSISPILSNIYLHSLDLFMESRSCLWIRFADNIYLFNQDQETAIEVYKTVSTQLKTDYKLEINQNKSGVHNVFTTLSRGEFKFGIIYIFH